MTKSTRKLVLFAFFSMEESPMLKERLNSYKINKIIKKICYSYDRHSLYLGMVLFSWLRNLYEFIINIINK